MLAMFCINAPPTPIAPWRSSGPRSSVPGPSRSGSSGATETPSVLTGALSSPVTSSYADQTSTLHAMGELSQDRAMPTETSDSRRLLDEFGLDTVEVAFADLWGYLCGKGVPRGRFLANGSEHSFPIAPLTWSDTGDIDASPLAGPDNGFPNVRFRCDLATLRPAPWREGVAICLLDAYTAEGDPFPLHGRHAVRAAIARLRA